MTRQQLEHVLRASAAVADEREIVVIGSQSILGVCLDPIDLAVSKLAAGRTQDLEYVRVMVRHHLVTPDTLIARVSQTNLAVGSRDLVLGRIAGLHGATGV